MDFDEIKTRILDRQELLLGLNANASLSTATVPLDQSAVGRLSRVDAMQQQQMSLEFERRRHRELVAIDNALTRIDQGEFGFCLECGEAINPKRLEIDLTATLCIRCAGALETPRPR